MTGPSPMAKWYTDMLSYTMSMYKLSMMTLGKVYFALLIVASYCKGLCLTFDIFDESRDGSPALHNWNTFSSLNAGFRNIKPTEIVLKYKCEFTMFFKAIQFSKPQINLSYFVFCCIEKAPVGILVIIWRIFCLTYELYSMIHRKVKPNF